MSVCSERNINNLRKAYRRKAFLSSGIRNGVALLIFEIIRNAIKNEQCRDCFSENVVAALEKKKQLLKYFLKKNNSLGKRKKKLLKSNSKVKRLIKRLIRDFFRNCTEEICGENA